MKYDKTETNPAAEWRMRRGSKRLPLKCNLCPPHKGENAGPIKRNGGRKKRKQR